MVSRDQKQIKDAMRTLDGIINTVSATHSLLPLLGLLKPKGKLVMVGAPEKPLELPVMPLIFGKPIMSVFSHIYVVLVTNPFTFLR